MAIVSKGLALTSGTDGVTYGSTHGYIKDVDGPNITVDDIDVTTNDSSNGWREFLPGLKDGGVVTFGMEFNKTEADEIEGLIGSSRYWRLALSDTSKWEFQGYINAFGTTPAFGASVTHQVSIKVSGTPTFTAAS